MENCIEWFSYIKSLSVLILYFFSILVTTTTFYLISNIILRSPKSSTLLMSVKEYEQEISKRSVYIRTESNFSIKCFISFIFGRWEIFSNTNNLNLKIGIKTVLVVTYSIITYFFLKEIIPGFSSNTNLDILALIVSFPTVFWHHHAVFYNKWKHCSNLYEQFNLLHANYPTVNFALDPLYRATDLKLREDQYDGVLENQAHMIILDVLHLDLWAHKSYYKLFNELMFEKLSKISDQSVRLEKIQKFVNGELSVDQIEKMIRSERT